MPHPSRFTLSTAAIALLAASPVAADVTPQQVWDNMETYLESFGYDVSSSNTIDGGTLTINDLEMRMDLPEDEGSFNLGMSGLVLTDLGDGTVQITMPASMPMTITADVAEEDVAFEGSFLMEQDGFVMTVSGAPGDMAYDYTANSMSMSLGDMMIDGQKIPAEVARMLVTMTGVSGKTTVVGETLRQVAQTVLAEQVSYDVSFVDPEGSGNGAFKGGMSNLQSASTAALPSDFDTVNMAKNFAAGFAVDGSFSYENGNTDFNITDDGQTMIGSASTKRSELSIVMNSDTLSYSGGSDEVAYSINGGEVPFPIDVSFERVAFNFAAPLAKEESGAFGLGIQIVGFTLPDILWGLFDPSEQLPRDPATITFDLAGQAKPLVDFFDPAVMASLEDSDEIPAELESLTLSDLRVSAAGAELTGAGAFTFDNSDTSMFDGMPKPMGEVNLKLVGADALIDKLIAMGLVKQEDAMGARMMMSMFTVPAGDDVKTTTLEVNEQGHVLANGQRIQ